MKGIFVYLALVTIVASTNYPAPRLQFPYKFFENKNSMITANVCWDSSKIFILNMCRFINYHYVLDVVKYFTKNILNGKQVSIFRNTFEYELFLKHLSSDNYFFLDLIDCTNSWNILQKVLFFCNMFYYHLK